MPLKQTPPIEAPEVPHLFNYRLPLWRRAKLRIGTYLYLLWYPEQGPADEAARRYILTSGAIGVAGGIVIGWLLGSA